MDKFDDSGMMALVCRHDIPLFLANIDTPGEQQKYSIAMIEHLFSLIPTHATVAVLYDVGCVLDRSLQLVSTFFYVHKIVFINFGPSMTFYLLILRRECCLQPVLCTHMSINGHVSWFTTLAYGRGSV